MSTTQTVTAEQAGPQSYSLTELRQPPPVKDPEASSGQDVVGNEAVDCEPATPFHKLIVAGYSFFCAGVNDGFLGPLIPYILSTFKIGTGEVAAIYFSTFAGWLLAAVTNPVLTAHLTLGQLLQLGAFLQFIAQLMRIWGPLPLFIISSFIQSLGAAYQDSHSNTFVSSLKNVPHRWLGFIHACYALGTFIGPLVATAIANSESTLSIAGWKRSYFVLIGIFFLDVVGVAYTFRDTLFSRLHSDKAKGQKRSRTALMEMARLLRSKTLWLLSIYYFFELGAVFTAGGWVVEYLTTVRGGNLAKVGYVPTGFYGGLLAGRLLLPEPTYRFGEQRMVLIYHVFAVALQLVFWLQPNIIGSAIALSFIGFFIGPFFATGMSVASKLFPRASQPAALGFIFVIAQAGSALFPSVTGLIARGSDVGVLQPIVLALFVAGGIVWWMIPKVSTRDE
ncbi:MFS general substrate transporter [Xylariaceae sp. FL1019]|nr:MFS general substrate transporter [Xylariaceae sp. FL1019]